MNIYIEKIEKAILDYENQSKIHWLRGEDEEFNRLLTLIVRYKVELEIAKKEQIG